MNQSDSERLSSGLEQMGLTHVPDLLEADVVVLNTCVVRQSAEDTATGVLGVLKRVKAEHPKRTVAVMGCMVGPRIQDLSKRFPHVDSWAQPQRFDVVLGVVGERIGVDPDGCVGSLVPAVPNVTSFVPIAHGCDKFCTFCIIPYRRGREVSRPIMELIREVEVLVDRGVKEITLLGQNVDSYGHDLESDTDLSDLLHAMNDVVGLARIRFLTSHPNDMSRQIIRAVADLPKVCESVNLPFQAGDDQVLERMRRGYTRRLYLDKIEELRSEIPGAALTTDLIVGFPGETRDQFQRTLDILEEVRFDKVHSAAYSERPGTIASRKMPDDVSRDEKKIRLKMVADVQEPIGAEINARYVGKDFEILVDGDTRGRRHGRTRTDKLVYIDGLQPSIGAIAEGGITSSSPWSVDGSIVESRNQSLIVL